MDIISLTKVRNYLEHSIDICHADQTKISEDLIPVLKQVKQAIRPSLNELINAAEGLRQRRIGMSSTNWLKFFQSHDYNPAEVEFYKDILAAFVSWQYPTLVLFPGVGKILPGLLGAEPLYIADWSDEVLNHCAAQFNDFYANKRLMQYKISKYDLSPLPQQSFGLVTSVNWTVFEGLDGLVEIANSVHNILLPGGIYMFNYNPLDRYWGVQQNIDQFGYGALTEDLISKLERIGFQILKINQQPSKMAYIICRKYGELDSPKLGSILAKIIATTDELL